MLQDVTVQVAVCVAGCDSADHCVLQDVVTVQKLQLLCGEGADADWPKLLGCLVVGGEEGDTLTAWDGSVSV